MVAATNNASETPECEVAACAHYTAHVRVLHQPSLSRLQQCFQISQPIIDLIVAVVSVPLLVMFGLLIQTQINDKRVAALKNGADNATENTTDSNRLTIPLQGKWTIIGLSSLTLILGCLICAYLLQRLGICMPSKNQQYQGFQEVYSTQADGRTPTNVSCTVQIYPEDPPSYEVVTTGTETPPPDYETVLMLNKIDI